MECHFCGENVFHPLFDAESFDDPQVFFQVTECTHCKLVRTEPILTAAQLAGWYQQEYYGNEEKKFLPLFEKFVNLNNSLRARKIYAHLEPRDLPVRILDIGCGRAQLLKRFAEMGCECAGVEREGFVSPSRLDGVRIYKQALDQIRFDDDYFDAVILWHSLEHLEQPFDVLREVHRILKPEGLIVIAVPNFASLQRYIFRNRWFHLDLPRHSYHFGLNEFASQLGSLGFRLVDRSTCSLEQNLYGFIQSFLNCLPTAKSNRLYSLLKDRRERRQDWLALLIWSLLAVVLLPAALLEYLISGLAGIGATFSLYGVKQ